MKDPTSVSQQFEFVPSPFVFVLQIFIKYCAPWRNTNSIQV